MHQCNSPFDSAQISLCCWLVIYVLGICASAVNSTLDNSLSPKEILEKNIQAQSYCKTIEMNFQTLIVEEHSKQKNIAIPTKVEGAYLRDGNRIQVSGKFLPPPDDKKAFRFRTVVNREIWMFSTTNIDPAAGGKSALDANHSGVSSSKFQEMLGTMLEHPWYGGGLDGYLMGTSGEMVTALLSDAPDLSVEDGAMTEDGTNCYRVEGTLKCGKASMWISKNDDFLLKKVVLRKDPSHIYELETTIKQLNEKTNGDIEKWSATVEATGYKRVEGKLIPIKGEMLVRIAYSSGKSYLAKYSFQRTNISLHPKITATTFQVDLEKGTPVAKFDEPNSAIQYIWDGSKVKPISSDFDGSATLADHNRRTIFLVCLALIGLLLLSVAFWVMTKQKKRNSNT